MTITTLFLDRDGVINKKIDNGYVTNLSELEFIESTLNLFRGLIHMT
jgi:histidinol phosphatase-like enzyme